jgi:hypothetical protein
MNIRIDRRETFEIQMQLARTLVQTRALLHRARRIADEASDALRRAPHPSEARIPDHEDRPKALL